MRILPLDTSSFRKIRLQNKLYVDKTKWIYRLIAEGDCYFLSRPRRFGKSLTINTLKELFRGNKELFQGLWIYDKWNFEPHPVIIFDFNNIPRHTSEALIEGLKDTIFEYGEEEGLDIGEKEKEAETLFLRLIKQLYKKYGKPTVILIDE